MFIDCLFNSRTSTQSAVVRFSFSDFADIFKAPLHNLSTISYCTSDRHNVNRYDPLRHGPLPDELGDMMERSLRSGSAFWCASPRQRQGFTLKDLEREEAAGMNHFYKYQCV